jgi:hypothetical protein
MKTKTLKTMMAVAAFALVIGNAGALATEKDFNGDGYSDLVWENTVTGQRAIWLMKNGVTQSGYYLPPVAPEWHIVGVADVMGDRNADLIWEDTVNGQHAIWFMKNGVVTSGRYLAGGSSSLPWQLVAVAGTTTPGVITLWWQHSSRLLATWTMTKGIVTSTSYLDSSPGNPNNQTPKKNPILNGYLQYGWRIVGAGMFATRGTAGGAGPGIVVENDAGIGWSPHPELPSGLYDLPAGIQPGTVAICVAGGDFYHYPDGFYFPDTPYGYLSFGWQIAGTGDFRGVGFSDLVLENPTTGQRAIWLNNVVEVGFDVFGYPGGEGWDNIMLPSVPGQWHIANH